jgi:hypothetical protein
MDALTKMDFVNYPVYENDVTPFVKRFLAFKTIYSAMLNSIDNEEIVSMLEENLKIFFERFEKYINSAPKMENENSLKQ